MTERFISRRPCGEGGVPRVSFPHVTRTLFSIRQLYNQSVLVRESPRIYLIVYHETAMWLCIHSLLDALHHLCRVQLVSPLFRDESRSLIRLPLLSRCRFLLGLVRVGVRLIKCAANVTWRTTSVVACVRESQEGCTWLSQENHHATKAIDWGTRGQLNIAERHDKSHNIQTSWHVRKRIHPLTSSSSSSFCACCASLCALVAAGGVGMPRIWSSPSSSPPSAPALIPFRSMPRRNPKTCNTTIGMC